MLRLFSMSEKSITILVEGPAVIVYLPLSVKAKSRLLITSFEPETSNGPTLKYLSTQRLSLKDANVPKYELYPKSMNLLRFLIVFRVLTWFL